MSGWEESRLAILTRLQVSVGNYRESLSKLIDIGNYFKKPLQTRVMIVLLLGLGYNVEQDYPAL